MLDESMPNSFYYNVYCMSWPTIGSTAGMGYPGFSVSLNFLQAGWGDFFLFPLFRAPFHGAPVLL